MPGRYGNREDLETEKVTCRSLDDQCMADIPFLTYFFQVEQGCQRAVALNTELNPWLLYLQDILVYAKGAVRILILKV